MDEVIFSLHIQAGVFLKAKSKVLFSLDVLVKVFIFRMPKSVYITFEKC